MQHVKVIFSRKAQTVQRKKFLRVHKHTHSSTHAIFMTYLAIEAETNALSAWETLRLKKNTLVIALV